MVGGIAEDQELCGLIGCRGREDVLNDYRKCLGVQILKPVGGRCAALDKLGAREMQDIHLTDVVVNDEQSNFARNLEKLTPQQYRVLAMIENL